MSKSQNYLYKEYKHKEYINQEKENLKFSQSTEKKDENLNEQENNLSFPNALPKEEKNCEKKEKTDDLNALNLKDEESIENKNKNQKSIKKQTKKECSDFIQSQFEEFWNKYGIKEDRKKCEAKFKSLTNEAREKILLTVESFVKYQYVKNKGVNGFRHRSPARYLNEENWNDEILPLNQNGNIEFGKRNEKKENSYLDEIDEILKNK